MLDETMRGEYHTKISVGIALVDTSSSRILLSRKRITYKFCKFANGHYYVPGAQVSDFCLGRQRKESIYEIFSGMTVEEKLIIMSLSFDAVYYHFHLRHVRDGNYFMLRDKFEEVFCADGGERLRRILASSTHGHYVWEIPKGRKNRQEPYLNCAVREFTEETGIQKTAYRILDAKKVHTRAVDGVKYVSIWYYALCDAPLTPRISLDNFQQYIEVGALAWMGLNEIKALPGCGEVLYGHAKGILSYVKALRRDAVASQSANAVASQSANAVASQSANEPSIDSPLSGGPSEENPRERRTAYAGSRRFTRESNRADSGDEDKKKQDGEEEMVTPPRITGRATLRTYAPRAYKESHA